ncbi:MAG: DUF4424 domain-containing protein [Xanthobacteraceae bacterium]
MRRLLIALFLAVVSFGGARANDSTAELATGGLVFVKNDAIEMRAEDLFISTAEIRVTYRFFNRTDRDVTVHVAFPLPAIKVEGMDDNISVPTEDPVNIFGFTTLVNGKPVRTQVEQRVTAHGIDRTRMLRDLGVPLAPHLAATNAALDKLPRDKWNALVKAGLAAIEEYDAGKGMEQHLAARWTLHTTFYWEQTFPANAETVIAHRYQPSVGGTVQTAVGASLPETEDLIADYKRKYCMDAAFLAAVKRAPRAADNNFPPFSEERIDYILSTGANWSGPIGDFRLVVDKGAPDNLVSFCGEGVKKIGPTQFEMRKTDFTPQGNFSVLILQRLRG